MGPILGTRIGEGHCAGGAGAHGAVTVPGGRSCYVSARSRCPDGLRRPRTAARGRRCGTVAGMSARSVPRSQLDTAALRGVVRRQQLRIAACVALAVAGADRRWAVATGRCAAPRVAGAASAGGRGAEKLSCSTIRRCGCAARWGGSLRRICKARRCQMRWRWWSPLTARDWMRRCYRTCRRSWVSCAVSRRTCRVKMGLKRHDDVTVLRARLP